MKAKGTADRGHVTINDLYRRVRAYIPTRTYLYGIFAFLGIEPETGNSPKRGGRPPRMVTSAEADQIERTLRDRAAARKYHPVDKA